MSTQKQKATSGRREVARSRMHTLSVLGGAGSVALAGMAAGAAAQAYAAHLAPPRPAALGAAAPVPTPIIGTLTEAQMLALDFALPAPPRPNALPAAAVAQTSSTRRSAPAAISAASVPGRGAPAAAPPSLALAPVPAPRAAPRPAAPAPVKTGQS